MAHISVLGAGAWGTALALAARQGGHTVDIWSPFEREIDAIKTDRVNPLLPGVVIPRDVNLTNDISCSDDSDLIITAVPSFAVLETAALLADRAKGKKRVIANAAKGFCPKTGRRFSEVIAEASSDFIPVALSGPSHAEEVSRGVATSIVSACEDSSAAEYVQDLMMTDYLRIYVNRDIVGVELGGALKNIIALCAGICDGMRAGDNTKAALITRGLSEIARLGVKMGAKSETFAGLSGLGDLIVTCDSMHSRNRRAGILIGQGKSADEAVADVGTVEGYYAVKAAHELCGKYSVEMPITESCYSICFENLSPETALKRLMTRPKKHEYEAATWLEVK